MRCASPRPMRARSRSPAARTKRRRRSKEFLSRFPDNALAQRRARRDPCRTRASRARSANPVEGAAEALAGIGAAVGQEGGTGGRLALSAAGAATSTRRSPAGSRRCRSATCSTRASRARRRSRPIESIAPEAPFRALGVMRAALALDRMDRTEEAEKAFKEAIAPQSRRHPEPTSPTATCCAAASASPRPPEIYSRGDRPHRRRRAKADWSLFYFRGISLRAHQGMGRRPRPISRRRWSSAPTSRWC